MWHGDVVQAECALAAFAVEVPVLVIVCVVAVAGAQLIAQGTASVLDAVYQVMLKEDGERAEDGAALSQRHALLQFLEREWACATLQLSIYE